ncbi:Protein of unknown function [Seinonella peptonophila]|uniref:DUF1292 domain-containing protein n=1 Tax=Seinonella peptonophila TaxID=112248 RepID=A0A1M4W9S3_9BACL|nr:DUF1292 domain-containing protein [Seinonella peptonophila]SHE77910.1 Protein of unknown function [Seinonella peptonophila]
MDLRTNNSTIEGKILHSFEYQGVQYVIWSEHEEEPEEAHLLRQQNQQLVHIDDEEEWEQVTEYVDEYLYNQQ